MTNNRQYELPLGELIDKLTITQLRELLLNTSKYESEIAKLSHDIDLIISEKNIKFNARLLRIVFLIGQLNTLIWLYKDKMLESEEFYAKYLKLSHQINGLKNELKNKLMQETGESVASLRTNIKTDGLEYYISI